MTNIMDYFDQVYLINLPKRTDRLANARHELSKITDHFQIVIPIEHEDPKMSFNMTCLSIMQEAKEMGFMNIAVFEDDVYIRNHDHLMDAILQANLDYDVLYLGANLNIGREVSIKPFSENLNAINGAWTTHAACYSLRAIAYIAKHYDPSVAIFDAWLSSQYEAGELQALVVKPMVAYQHVSYSDLWERQADYTNAFIESDKKLL